MKSDYINDDILRDKLKDKRITEVARLSDINKQSLYNFASGRTGLSLQSKCKLVNYFLTT